MNFFVASEKQTRAGSISVQKELNRYQIFASFIWIPPGTPPGPVTFSGQKKKCDMGLFAEKFSTLPKKMVLGQKNKRKKTTRHNLLTTHNLLRYV